MPFYHKLGQVPHKRHVQFKNPDGKLYREELMGLEGFSSIQSILYHHFLPPRVTKTGDLGPALPEYADFGPIRHRALATLHAPVGADPVSARIPLLGNRDVILGVARPNLAPFSFFNAVCSNPPTVVFCPMIRGADGKTKDTLNNVRATGEFVVNIVTEALAEAMNLSSVEAPPGVNEFEFARVTAEPSITARPPRVRESPVHFECRVRQIVEIGSGPGGGSLVIGEVLRIHVDERVLVGGDKINLAALKPVGRLAGSGYVRVTDVFEMERPKTQIKG